MKKINFAKESDARLKKFLLHYCLPMPEDTRGTFLRGEAINTLQALQEKMATEEDRRVKVLFHRTGDHPSGDYVFAGLNGVGTQIPFETEGVIPESLLRVMDDAKSNSFKQNTTPTGDIFYTTITNKLYPYTIIEYMSPDAMMVPDDEDSDK